MVFGAAPSPPPPAPAAHSPAQSGSPAATRRADCKAGTEACPRHELRGCPGRRSAPPCGRRRPPPFAAPPPPLPFGRWQKCPPPARLGRTPRPRRRTHRQNRQSRHIAHRLKITSRRLRQLIGSATAYQQHPTDATGAQAAFAQPRLIPTHKAMEQQFQISGQRL